MRERFNVNKIEVVVAISFLIVGILLYVLTDNFLGLGWLCCLICIVYFFVDVPFSRYYYKKLQKQRKAKEKNMRIHIINIRHNLPKFLTLLILFNQSR